MPDAQNLKKEFIEQRIKAITEDLFAVTSQLNSEIDGANRKRLQRRSADILKEWKELEDELQSLSDEKPNASTSVTARTQLKFDDDLPKIDFQALEKAIRKIIKVHSDEGCTALFLFQKSNDMRGDLCAKRINQLLSAETDSGLLDHFRFEFQAREVADSAALLRRLSSKLGIEEADQKSQDLLMKVVQKICGSLQNSSIVILECCGYHFDATTLRWVLDDFWAELVREVARIAKKYHGVTVFMLFFVAGTLPKNCVTAQQCCTIREFHQNKFLSPPLKKWTREDIKQWINRYSGQRLLRDELELVANNIHGATGGMPNSVVEALRREYVLVLNG